MIYITGLGLFLCLFAYFATWIDKKTGIDDLTITWIVGIIACAVWPISIALTITGGPLFLLFRLGAKRRGDI